MRLIRLFFALPFLCACSGSDDAPNDAGAVIVTAPGTPTGAPTTQVVGASGGTVTDGHVTIAIPAGALTTDATISITPITNTAPLGGARSYRFGPEDTTFAVPVTLTFDCDDANSWIVTQNDDGSWTPALDSVFDSGTVSAQSTHFSDWATARFIDLTLEPASTEVMVNKTVNLTLTGFSSQNDRLVRLSGDISDAAADGDFLAPLVGVDKAEHRFEVSGWSLNGVDAPTSGAAGQLSPSAAHALYTAPPKVPSQNPVAVSVSLVSTTKELKRYDVVSNIRVIDKEETTALTLTYDGEVFRYLNAHDAAIASQADGVIRSVEAHYDASNDTLEIDASRTTVSPIAQDAIFRLDLVHPQTGAQQLPCIYNEVTPETASRVEMKLNHAAPYSRNAWIEYTPETTCSLDYLCTEVTVTLTTFGRSVKGTLTGKTRDDLGDAITCTTGDEHTIAAEFDIAVE